MSSTINASSGQQAVSAKIALQSASISVDSIPYIPNSLKIVTGAGTAEVKAETLGNGEVQTYYCENDSEKISHVTFEVKNDSDNLELILALKSDQTNFPGGASLFITEVAPQIDEVYTGMYLINDPERSFSSDGNVSLEFKGNPVIA